MCRRLWVVASFAVANLGCAEQLHLLDRGPTGGISPCSFWPPPPGSATWNLEPSGSLPHEALRSVAQGLELRLREGGYSEQRWYPIGTAYGHGFAVTTRLEQLEDGSGRAPRKRWSSLYAEAANLKWLIQARTPTLPQPGRYRVFLVAYTDLPIGRSSNAPIWNEETMMDWPDAAHASSFHGAAVPELAANGYRLGIYEYEYVWDEIDARGRLLPADTTVTSGRAPRAAPLGGLGFTPR
jgi:hypothetical protein